MHRITFIILGLLVISTTELLAQKRVGLRLDNYQGINSIFLNPTNSSTQKLNWNLNLVSAGVFGETDYGFLENSSLSNSTKKTIISRPDLQEGAMPDLNQFVVLDFDNADSRKFAEVNAFITGPSFMAHLDNHHFGAFINYRFHAAEQNIDKDLGYYTNRRLPLTDSIDLDRTQIASMLWREIGGHYTHCFETNFGHIAIGGNLKYLSGIEALGIETTRTSELKRLSPDEISAETVNLSIMGTTTAIDLDDNFGKSAKGTGLGMDIGVSFVFEDYEDDYKLKLGLAINDIGSITFDEGVEGHVLESNNRTIFNKQDYLELTGIRDIVNRASNNILGNPSASLDPSISQIKMGLPTSLVLNADYKVMDQVYVGAVMVQRLPKTKIGLEKSNLLALAPRYESKWIGASMPITMVNYKKVHVGLSLRLAYLTIGTDQLGTLGTQKKLSSGDAFISLQFFGFNNDGLFNRQFQGKGKKDAKCYDM